MNAKNNIAVLLVATLLCVMTGCGIRVRIPANPESEMETILEEIQPNESKPSVEEELRESPETTEVPEQSLPTQEDSTSERKEYSEQADAELSSDAENTVAEQHLDSDAPPMASDGEGLEAGAVATDWDADFDVTETISADEAKDIGIEETAQTADTVLQYYMTLLTTRLSNLFECQRLYTYWETATDYQTVFRTSTEHEVILLAGSYDISAKLQENALLVDDGWVARKNPGAIVKCVGADVLGSGVGSTASAEAVCSAILSRPNWNTMDAGKTQTVIVLSESLLQSIAGQTAAAIYMAKAMYPDAMRDVDADEALQELMKESAGKEISGIYAYIG